MDQKLAFPGDPEERSYMIDFEEIARITCETDNTLAVILAKRYDTFEQYEEVSKITDIEVAKLIIKRLLDKLN